MKNIFNNIFGVTLLLAASYTSPLLAQQVQWCAVTSAGQVVYCFPTKEACTAMKAGGQDCVAMPTGK